MLYELYINETILVVEGLTKNIHQEDVSDGLIFNQTIFDKRKDLDISDSIILREKITRAGGIITVDVNESLVFIEKLLPRVFDYDVYDVLTLSDENLNDNIIDHLIFLENLSLDQNSYINDPLTINENIILSFSKKLIISDSLIIIEKVIGALISDRFARPSVYGLQINNHITQFVCGSDIINLPSPDFDNKESLQYTRINAKTRGGDLIIGRQSYWPKSRTFTLQWTYLNKTIKSQMIVFLQKNLGKLVTLNDHENRTYQGIIINPDTEVRDNSYLYNDPIDNKNSNGNSMTIEFETIN